jgi:hypothetical protein
MEPDDSGMDGLLRRSLAAPIPRLSPDFGGRVMRRVIRKTRRGSRPLDRYGRLLLSGYGAVSVATCAVIMRSQGLDWWVIAATTLAPLVLAAVARPVWRATHARPPRAAG